MADGSAGAQKAGTCRWSEGTLLCVFLRLHGRQRRNDKGVYRAARPAAEDLRQGEGRTVLAILGTGPSMWASWRRSARRTQRQRPTMGRRASTASRSRPSKRAASRGFSNSSGTHWSPARTRPLRCRKQAIPKADGRKVRILSIPAIRDRVVQGALKGVLEPIFEADFQPGSCGYRPQKSAHQAVDRVTAAIRQHKTRVVDLDLRAYLDAASYCSPFHGSWSKRPGCESITLIRRPLRRPRQRWMA